MKTEHQQNRPHADISRWKEVFEDQDALVSPLLVGLFELYGKEPFDDEWAPETLLRELKDDCNVILPSLNLDRLMAGYRLVTSDAFYNDTAEFCELTEVLAGHPMAFGYPALPDVRDCSWSLLEGMLLAPPMDNPEDPFDPEIKAYINYAIQQEGIMSPPAILRFALKDQSLAGKVQSDYSDDPDMFAAIWQTEQGKTDSINDFVRHRLSQLHNQLKRLPLHTGQAQKVLRNLSRSLGSPV